MKGLWEMNCCIRMASEPVNFITPIQAMTTTRPYRTIAEPTAVMM